MAVLLNVRQLKQSELGYDDVDSDVKEYEVLQGINRGSCGAVYGARNNQTNQIVAMKFEFNGLSPSTMKEIQILKSLPRHPSIVKFNEVVIDEYDRVFVVMEYVEKDLRRFMDFKTQDFTVSEVKFVMKQILEGVSFLHKQGVMHRDLKPSNILVDRKGALKICDFGLSCNFGKVSQPKSCDVGTGWYMAPELFVGDAYYTCAVDMWAVGCIMAELILNEVLFKGKSKPHQLQIIYKLVGVPCWNLLRLKLDMETCFYGAPFLTNAGHDLLERLLSVDPAKRISAEDALNHKWFKEYYGLST